MAGTSCRHIFFQLHWYLNMYNCKSIPSDPLLLFVPQKSRGLGSVKKPFSPVSKICMSVNLMERPNRSRPESRYSNSVILTNLLVYHEKQGDGYHAIT
jgi:hypothetical protein